MGKLIYTAITSLDGYTVDRDGGFGWAEPDAEVHAAVNELERGAGTHLYGRRMYEVMRFWQTAPTTGDAAPESRDYAALWQAADKVVFSRTLTGVDTPRTELVPAFDPADVLRRKEKAAGDLSVGGAGLAAEALRAGLVDECHLFAHPVVVGGGTSWLPELRLELELLDQRRFGCGVVHLHYAIRH